MYADDIVIDPRERGMQINKNSDDNSDIAKIQNKNMNEVPYYSKIVREEKEPRDQDCTDDENSNSTEVERHRKLESVGRFTKMKIQNVIMNMLIIVISLVLLHALQ